MAKRGAARALPARRGPAALAAVTQGPGSSCSWGLSVLIYYSPRLDCLIGAMCSGLH